MLELYLEGREDSMRPKDRVSASESGRLTVQVLLKIHISSVTTVNSPNLLVP